jgi:glucokinase
MFLAGDVGATKILLEVGELRSGRWYTRFSRHYDTRDEVNFPEALHQFLSEWNGAGTDITAAAFGVAGPPQDNKVKMTHRPWVVDGGLLSDRFSIPHVKVVNDLAASAHGIDWLDEADLLEIQPGERMANEPRVVIGVGTGLGISYVIRANGHVHEIPGEAGHANFAPGTLQQMALWQEIFSQHGRVSNEDILSGAGLQHVYAFTSGQGAHIPGTSETPTPAQISHDAIEMKDAKALAALNLFFECLGNAAGDHALSVLARGGVYLTGGVIAKNLPALNSERLRSAFCAKGPHAALLMRVPIYALKSERAGLLGAARYATEAPL